MREAVRRIYRERKALTASLKVSPSSISHPGWNLSAFVAVGCGFCRREAGRSALLRYTPDFHLHLLAYLQ